MDRPTLSYEQLAGKLPLDDMNIDEELKNHAVYYEMICLETARNACILQKLKTMADTLAGKTKMGVRKDYAERNQKAPTADEAKDNLCQNEEYKAMQDTLADAEYHYNRWYSLKKAYEHRHECSLRLCDLIRSGYMGHYEPKQRP